MADDASGILICQATRRNMQFSFMWPNFGEELNPGRVFYIKLFTFLLVYSLVPFATLMHTINIVTNNIDLHITEDLGAMGSIFGIMYMAILYIRNQPKIAALLKDLSHFEDFSKPPGFEELNKKQNVLSHLAFMYPTCGAFTCNMIKLLQKSSCEAEMKYKYPDEKCGLMYPFWIPFEINYFPLFHLIFVYVCVSNILFVRLHLSIFCQALEIVQHIILRINQLISMMSHIFDEYDFKKSCKNIKECVLYHQEILRLAARLDESFSGLMFLHFVMTATICACLEKQLVDGVAPITGGIHLVGWIMSIFIAAYGGQQLVNASELLAESVWSSEWYLADYRLQKDIMFIVIKSQKELCINVGSFGVLSYAFFLGVMKMSYSVLAMLKS